ncbi:MAG: Rrf2 family transcriptional regulator [Gammaproteobacteria bacterium]
MQLTRYTDYSLRVLMHLALNPEELGHISDIAESFNISRNHLIKVVNNLVKLGYVYSKRGRSGGLELAYEPETLSIGEVVRVTEQNLEVVNCIEPACPFSSACYLKSVLNQATEAFLSVLDDYTLADLIKNKKGLKQLLG